jgi:hypothetical protein
MLTMETAAVTHLPSGPSRRRALALIIAARRRLTPPPPRGGRVRVNGREVGERDRRLDHLSRSHD